MGIYLDNFTSNYPIHHNVCWGIDGDAIRLNKPSLYNVVAHNTLIGFSGYWARWKTDWMYGCIYASNLMTEHIQLYPQLTLTVNVLEVGEEKLNRDNFSRSTAGIDKGLVVPGISGLFAGAYEHGMPAWKPGHNVAKRPNPQYQLTDTPLRNRIQHGSFDWQKYSGQFGPWRKTHAKATTLIGGGSIEQAPATRNNIIGTAVCLQGEHADGWWSCLVSPLVVGLHVAEDLRFFAARSSFRPLVCAPFLPQAHDSCVSYGSRWTITLVTSSRVSHGRQPGLSPLTDSYVQGHIRLLFKESQVIWDTIPVLTVADRRVPWQH